MRGVFVKMSGGFDSTASIADSIPTQCVFPEEAVLRQLPRLLRCELQRALCESHLWLSLWARPPRSPFTRLQRATCCALLLQLLLLANALWYGAVLDLRFRYGNEPP